MSVLIHNPQTGTYDFETDAVAGSIQPEGAYHGVTRLTDKRSGRQVIHPKYSALNLFRLFASHQGMGQPRQMPRTVEAGPEAVTVRWAATEAHQGEIVARYSVAEPDGVDLAVTLRCAGTYAGYELFMSNYFDPALIPHVYLKPNRASRVQGEPDRVVPMVSDVYRGTVLVFPRDAHSARRSVDGRWERSEWGSPTVQMCPVRHHALPLAFAADADQSLGVVVMSRPADCYAISTRYHAEVEVDRLTPYCAFDMSLFGGDLTPGDECTVRVRLALTPLDEGMTQPVALYRRFERETTDVRRET